MEGYHESVTPTATPPLRPYEFIATPAITLILDAIAAHCDVGGSIKPGVRQLAEWAGVSQGNISPCLHTLADDGWITYDGAWIRLVRSPDQAADQATDQETDRDQWIDRPTDQGTDRPADQHVDRDQSSDRRQPISPLIGAVRRVLTRQEQNDQGADRFEAHMVDHDLVAAAEEHESAAAALKNLPCAPRIDQLVDRSHPAAQVLAELGASYAVIGDALRTLPDLTPEQVRATWAHFSRRVAAGRCEEGAFFGAIRRGELHAAPAPPPASPPVNDAGDDERAFQAAYHRARALAPPGTSHAAMTELIYAILDGATDDQALDLLSQLRGAP